MLLGMGGMNGVENNPEQGSIKQDRRLDRLDRDWSEFKCVSRPWIPDLENGEGIYDKRGPKNYLNYLRS